MNKTAQNKWVYRLLMLVAGFYGGYAMLMRGGAFSNAQTGNVVLCALALGQGQWQKAAYYLIPMSAYMLGCFVSELHEKSDRAGKRWSWETTLVFFEMVSALVMGFIPATAPHQICQILINLICAMRLTTFRQSEGVPMATIFCTNHIRQIGVALAAMLRKETDPSEKLHLIGVHGFMVLSFMIGVAASAVTSHLLGVQSIWCIILPLAVVFVHMLRADRKAI